MFPINWGKEIPNLGFYFPSTRYKGSETRITTSQRYQWRTRSRLESFLQWLLCIGSLLSFREVPSARCLLSLSSLIRLAHFLASRQRWSSWPDDSDITRVSCSIRFIHAFQQIKSLLLTFSSVILVRAARCLVTGEFWNRAAFSRGNDVTLAVAAQKEQSEMTVDFLEHLGYFPLVYQQESSLLDPSSWTRIL